MIIFPAIDLRHGRCVRLRQGDPNAETVFSEDPAGMARHWADQGAEWLHVVNLDGALGSSRSHLNVLHRPASILVQRPGKDAPTSSEEELARDLPLNLQRLREIRSTVDLPIQFGGGLRTLDDIQLALELGADRVVLGTAAVENPSLISEALLRWTADRIVIGIDARNGMVATHGWQQESHTHAIELGHHMQALGIQHIIYTDISRDGMLSGVNLEATARLGDVTGLKVIASGGVASINDIETLKFYEHYNIEGVIVGQALYAGKLDLTEAIAVGRRALQRRSAGIMPFRRSERGLEFLLLYNLYFEQWQFPRGAVTNGESDDACARREFGEETGLNLVQFYPDCRSELRFTVVIRDYDLERTVVYYLAQVDSGEIRLGHENHCEARWSSAEETWELLTETAPEQLPAFDTAMEYIATQHL